MFLNTLFAFFVSAHCSRASPWTKQFSISCLHLETVVRLLYVDACFRPPPFRQECQPNPVTGNPGSTPAAYAAMCTVHMLLILNCLSIGYEEITFRGYSKLSANTILTEFYVYVSILVSNSNIYQQYLSGAWTLEINFKL